VHGDLLISRPHAGGFLNISTDTGGFLDETFVRKSGVQIQFNFMYQDSFRHKYALQINLQKTYDHKESTNHEKSCSNVS
jgi:hypothetical protein